MKRNIKINMAKFLASTLLVTGSISGSTTDLAKDISSSAICSLASVLAPVEVQASAVSLALPYVNETTQSNSSTYQQPTASYNNGVDSAMTFGVLSGDSSGLTYQQPTASYNNGVDSEMTFGMLFGDNSGTTYQQPTTSYNNGVDSEMTFGMLFGDNSGTTYQQPTASYNNGVANYDDYTMMITGNSNNYNSYTPLISSVSFKIGETSSIIDVAPYVENGNTMIPVRAMANLLGVSDNNITYDNNTQRVTITYYGKIISLTIGDNKLYITENGTTTVKTMENGAKAVTKDGRTFVPVRAISEAFGLQVGWNNDTQTVTLSS